MHWEGFLDATSTPTSFLQVYDAFGNPVGGEQQFTPDGTLQAVLSPVAGGGFIAVWQDFEASGGLGIVRQMFDATGGAIGAVVPVSSETDPSSPADQYLPAITRLDGGGFAVGYLSLATNGDFVATIRILDAAGDPVGNEIIVAAAPSNEIGGMSVTAIGDGRFAMVWHNGVPPDINVAMQLFEQDGTPASAIVPIGAGGGNQNYAAIASHGDGQFLLTYNDTETAGALGQLFSSTGVPIGTAFSIANDSQHGTGSYYARSVALPDGGYFSVWIEYATGGVDMVAGQLFDAEGNKVGDEILLAEAENAAAELTNPHLTVLADGRIALAWNAETTTGADTDGLAVFSKILDPRGGVINGTNHTETIVGSKDGTGVADTITAKDGNDTIGSYDGNDTIFAGAGNDFVVGGDGADSMDGGEGNDEFIVDDIGDVIGEAAGGGNDKVMVYTTAYTLDARAEVETLTIVADENADLIGNDFGQLLQGNGWANKLEGLGGNDTLQGGGDIDTLVGGAGDDLYYVDSQDQVLVEAAGEGSDTVNSSITYSLQPLTEFENLTLTGPGDLEGAGNGKNNLIVGTDGSNLLTGLGGNDTLDGGDDGDDSLVGGEGDDRYVVRSKSVSVTELADQGSDTIVSSIEGGKGNDTMEGGKGDDTFVVQEAGDVVKESVDAGTDKTIAYLDHTLAANVENLQLAAGITGKGNGLDNRLTGNGAGNALLGFDGNDVIDGGAGNDTMTGGKGNDFYVVAQAGDQVKESASQGIDTVKASINHTLASNVEKLVLAAGVVGTGNSLDNTLVGNGAGNALNGLDGKDTLDGATGNDTMSGGKGDDFYIVGQAGDQVKENSNQGIDTVKASVNHTLAANVENLILLSGVVGTGNGLANKLTAMPRQTSSAGLTGTIRSMVSPAMTP